MLLSTSFGVCVRARAVRVYLTASWRSASSSLSCAGSLPRSAAVRMATVFVPFVPLVSFVSFVLFVLFVSFVPFVFSVSVFLFVCAVSVVSVVCGGSGCEADVDWRSQVVPV